MFNGEKHKKWIVCTVNAEYEWEKSQGITLCLSHAPKDSSLMMQMQIISIQISLVYQFNIINHERANGICIDASVSSCSSMKLQSMECICNLLFICLFAIQIKLLFCFVKFFFWKYLSDLYRRCMCVYAFLLSWTISSLL